MPISATVNAVFTIDSKAYTASINIPDSTPTAIAPFHFSVTSQAPASGGTTPPPQTLLQVAVGAASQVYVAVSPPMDVISGAVGSDIVQDLNMVVSEGKYDVATGQFTG
ncbi:hypothetical protein [Nitrosospira sp. NRS527]|uniref:hypothetical protein n=1 Tax=Nitrosospira sp. NRS527 TaxID=155925 RepID=UPI001AF8DC73|nr:hypothetical protein [Nitrosospira sp. NRS527]BCT68216.1 hypothetical protein NNRS527_01808 [Nitrosospira sp. NRS527]